MSRGERQVGMCRHPSETMAWARTAVPGLAAGRPRSEHRGRWQNGLSELPRCCQHQHAGTSGTGRESGACQEDIRCQSQRKFSRIAKRSANDVSVGSATTVFARWRLSLARPHVSDAAWVGTRWPRQRPSKAASSGRNSGGGVRLGLKPRLAADSARGYDSGSRDADTRWRAERLRPQSKQAFRSR